MRKPIHHLLAVPVMLCVVCFMETCLAPIGGYVFVFPGQRKVIQSFPVVWTDRLKQKLFNKYPPSRGWQPTSADCGTINDSVLREGWEIGFYHEEGSPAVEEFVLRD
jgi:hypothetical protein